MTTSFVEQLIEKNRHETDTDTFNSYVKKAQEEKKCVWQREDECSTELCSVTVFNKQIAICPCTHHYESHIKIMMLHAYGDDVDEVLSDNLSTRFAKTFGSQDVNRDSCIALFKKFSPNISMLTDEELVDKLSAIL